MDESSDLSVFDLFLKNVIHCDVYLPDVPNYSPELFCKLCDVNDMEGPVFGGCKYFIQYSFARKNTIVCIKYVFCT